MPGFLVRALRSRVSAAGVALTTASALLFLALVALDLFGYLDNPYIGILTFILAPAVFVAGLLLIPAGLWLDRRQSGPAVAWSEFNLGDPQVRRATLFVAAMTVVNLGILSVASFGAVEYSESQAFCGQSCHQVMGPEFTAHQDGPHARVHCVSCHVAPDAGAFLAAKFNGSRQLGLVLMNSFQRPIPAPIHNLPATAETCERCHWPDRLVGDVVKVFAEHSDDEANTPSTTRVTLHVGGAVSGTGSGTGIHWHMNRANVVEYVATDEKRETIPYVRTQTPDGIVREYFAEGVSEKDIAGKPRRRMDCVDCHNRPAHAFGTTPERAIDEAIVTGLIDKGVPFIRREAVKALRVPYASRDLAAAQIERSIRDAINARLPHVFEEAALRQAVDVTRAIYARHVFPSMNIGWGTYLNHGGHTTSAGCFRCHDESHKTRDGRVIAQNCESCHAIE